MQKKTAFCIPFCFFRTAPETTKRDGLNSAFHYHSQHRDTVMSIVAFSFCRYNFLHFLRSTFCIWKNVIYGYLRNRFCNLFVMNIELFCVQIPKQRPPIFREAAVLYSIFASTIPWLFHLTTVSYPKRAYQWPTWV